MQKEIKTMPTALSIIEAFEAALTIIQSEIYYEKH